MPIFHKNKILFIHIPKTAGTSIEHYLIKKDNVVINYKDNVKNLFSYNGKYGFDHSLQHLTFKEILLLYPKVEEYKKFTVVRNPYDRIVSEYYYHLQITRKWKKQKTEIQEDFEEFLNFYFNTNDTFDNHKIPQYKYIEGINENDIKIMKFETLKTDFMDFFNEELQYHINKTKRDKNYLDILTPNTIKKINEYYYEDFIKFNYELI
jgi:hypothetical protein